MAAGRHFRHDFQQLVVNLGYAPEETAEGKMPERKIVVPLDGSETAEQILPYVVDHAKICDSEVVLLRVCERPLITADYPEANMQLSWKEHVERMTSYWQQQCNIYLEDVEKRVAAPEVEIKSEVLFGNAPDQIINYVESNQFNLIAMTTHGHSGVSRWVLGSVAAKVLDGTSTPILLARAR
uniref:UspA domain-containing protein n=1 Tax=bacterium enrichment culture clone fosmid MGS-K1 TaxID=1549356 RepID=A0A0B5KHA2_9BACT|nr:UspA domain-containing protein [bacterium enrichment culture clone fosmid MGS-K1]